MYFLDDYPKRTINDPHILNIDGVWILSSSYSDWGYQTLEGTGCGDGGFWSINNRYLGVVAVSTDYSIFKIRG